MIRLFSYTIEKDEDGYYIAEVHQLPGCRTQSKSLDELQERLKEAIELYLEAKPIVKNEKYTNYYYDNLN